MPKFLTWAPRHWQLLLADWYEWLIEKFVSVENRKHSHWNNWDLICDYLQVCTKILVKKIVKYCSLFWSLSSFRKFYGRKPWNMLFLGANCWKQPVQFFKYKFSTKVDPLFYIDGTYHTWINCKMISVEDMNISDIIKPTFVLCTANADLSSSGKQDVCSSWKMERYFLAAIACAILTTWVFWKICSVKMGNRNSMCLSSLTSLGYWVVMSSRWHFQADFASELLVPHTRLKEPGMLVVRTRSAVWIP